MSGVRRVVFMLDGCVHCEPLSSDWDHLPRYVLASDYDTLCDEWRVATGAVIMQRKELAELRDELAALKACQGEAVAWANWKVGTKSYVPYRTKEDAERCVRQSEIAATQNGPYKVVPPYAAPSASADSMSVPVELMRRLTKRVMLRSQEGAHADACEELRALLARQGVKS